MNSILWIVGSLPEDERHGGYLRFIKLAGEIAKKRRSYLAILDTSAGKFQSAADRAIFDDVAAFVKPAETRPLLKHVRLSNRHFLAKSNPEYLRDVVTSLSRLVESHGIGTAIGVTIRTAEVLEALPCPVTIVDDYDCVTLTLERYKESGDPAGQSQGAVARFLQYQRIKALERSLTSRFSLVTTISRADRRRLQELAPRRREAIRIVKNGVDPDLLSFDRYGPVIERSLVFWGNLSFPPNYQAVRYFYREVFAPYLESRGIRWYIIGANASPEITALGEKSPNIHVTGFVEDLAGLVAQIPVMVNPMISGSGLKNKVLEAFALRRAVVSTSMGADAIEAEAGVHYVECDTPAEMAEQTLMLLTDDAARMRIAEAAQAFVRANYRWDAIGARFHDLIAEAEAAAPETGVGRG